MNKEIKTTKEERHEIYSFIEERIGKIPEDQKCFLSERFKRYSRTIGLNDKRVIAEQQITILKLQNELAKSNKKSKYNNPRLTEIRTQDIKKAEERIERISNAEKKEKEEMIRKDLSKRTFLPD